MVESGPPAAAEASDGTSSDSAPEERDPADDDPEEESESDMMVFVGRWRLSRRGSARCTIPHGGLQRGGFYNTARSATFNA